jgi:hypothetical protein
VSGLSGSVNVSGVSETVAALDMFGDTLRQQSRDEAENVARAVAGTVSSALPAAPPLSGMARGRLTYGRGVSVRLGEDQSDRPDRWRLFAVALTAPAAAMADMAGRGSGGRTPSGQGMIRALSARYGRASRFVWPSAQRALPQIEGSLQTAVDLSERQVTSQLDKVG